MGARPDGHRGFTLVEVLVIVTIVALLIALLTPAVHSARETARHTACRNNLRQIGLAFQGHEHAWRAFPSGGRPYGGRTMVNDAPAFHDRQAWAWAYQILPHLELEPLWRLPSDDAVAATPVAGYFCPSRRPPTVIKGGYWAYSNTFRAMIDYAGNAGTSGEGGDGGGMYGNGRDGAICTLDVGVRTANQIRDGLSLTLLVGEKRLNLTYCTTDQQPDDNQGYVGGFQDDVVRWGPSDTPWGSLTPAADFSGAAYTWSTIRPAIWQFGSSHLAGATFVHGDGSVRVIGFTSDPLTFSRLCGIRDAGAVDANGL